MKQRIFILTVFLFLGLYPQTAHACSCAAPLRKEEQEKALAAPVDEEVKKFWLEQFNGAVFVGTVVKIEKVNVKWFREKQRMKKVTVRVERAWVGVTEQTFVIYTTLGKGGDCGVPYEKGHKYFFMAEVVGGLHSTNICTSWEPDNFWAKLFEKMFGQGSRPG
jgi:hypothetical protein